MKQLWKRAPLWRMSIYGCLLCTLLAIVYSPRHAARPPALTAMAGDASYIAPPEDKSVERATSLTSPQKPLGTTHAQSSTVLASSNAKTPPSTSHAPQKAQLSLAIPGDLTPSDGGISGIDPALLGRTYHESISADGFQLPLPKGEWAILAHGTVKNNRDPNNTGTTYFLGHIEHKILASAIIVTAMRSESSPPSGFEAFEPCSKPDDNIFTNNDAMVAFGHQACWFSRTFFTPPWQQWADKAVNLNYLVRAAAGDLSAKGVNYAQDYVVVQFYRAEDWGKLQATYLFNPEQDHILSNVAMTEQDSDWSVPRLKHSPEKLAYVSHLKSWAEKFWPAFQRSFDSGRTQKP